MDGVSPPLSPVLSGVPQGSMIGPLLFIIFINAINYLPLSPVSKLVLYADDIDLYRPINSPEDVTIIQEDINQTLNWTKAHGLTLNPAYQLLALPGQFEFTLILDQILSKLSVPSSSWVLPLKNDLASQTQNLFVWLSLTFETEKGCMCAQSSLLTEIRRRLVLRGVARCSIHLHSLH